ncbi:MAG: isochorismatase family protein [Oligoflexales bacterium]
MCVLETALDLKKQGWNVVVPVDAVQSSTKQKWKWGLQQMNQEGIHVSNCETILFHCLRDSKHPSFKEFSNLLKRSNMDND